MELERCIKERRSIRKFSQQPVNREDFETMIALASCAPSWKNSQVVRYVLVEDETLKNKIATDCVSGFAFNAVTIGRASALIVQTVVHGRSGFEKDGSVSTSKGDRWEVFDAGISAATLCLAAHSIGYGTVMMGIFDEDNIHALLALPADQKVTCIIPIGIPAEAPDMPPRKDVAALVSYK